MKSSNRSVNGYGSIAGIALLAGALVGCGGNNKTTSPAERVDNPAKGLNESPSRLSYGTVTSTVKKNVTTQAELLDLFGGPNISTTDKDGTEVWVYERTSTVNDTAGSAEANNLSAFFGGGVAAGPAAAGGGVAGSKSQNTDQRRSTQSVRTLTVTVKFNTDKTVKDYAARASNF